MRYLLRSAEVFRSETERHSKRSFKLIVTNAKEWSDWLKVCTMKYSPH